MGEQEASGPRRFSLDTFSRQLVRLFDSDGSLSKPAMNGRRRTFTYKCLSFQIYHIAIDIWSVGVILLCFLTGRFPFFHSDDDLEALLEIAVVFGQREMAAVAATFSESDLGPTFHFYHLVN